ncbi:anti-sigma factor family protein [Embleya sp. NPDC050493]|uniref:anti-sigma factor family protein n=1 Tax=Embleya sp. NPDC050493 TaxID=3363989 RepID=UPI003798EEF9
MSIQPEHADIAAYALGLLEPADRDAFEEHLATCDRCLDELADFSGMATLLTELRDEGVYELPESSVSAPPAAPALPAEPTRTPGPVLASVAEPTATSGAAPTQAAESGPVDELGARRAARRRSRPALLVAACVALLVIGLGAGVLTGRTWLQKDSSTSARNVDPFAAVADNGTTVAATDPRTGAAARLALESKAWGTNLALELRNVRGPLRCSLVAVGKDGKEQQVSSWTVPAKGYGVPGSEAPLVIRTGTWTPTDQLARFDVRIADGGTLVGVSL